MYRLQVSMPKVNDLEAAGTLLLLNDLMRAGCTSPELLCRATALLCFLDKLLSIAVAVRILRLSIMIHLMILTIGLVVSMVLKLDALALRAKSVLRPVAGIMTAGLCVPMSVQLSVG